MNHPFTRAFAVFILAAIAVLAPVGGASAATEPATFPSRPVPDFGLMLNNDGDQSYPSADPREGEAALRRMIATMQGTPVRTLVYSIGAGSDILYYPTQVASNFGWRKTKLDDDPVWAERVHHGRIAAAAGIDPVRAVGEQARVMGLRFFPSYRMNDMHFVVDPDNYPLTGKFWTEHRSFQIGRSPIKGWDYSPLFDYTHPEVREFRLKVIYEAIDRFADIMDGLQLDFVRFQVFFPPGEAEGKAHLITEMVAQVRRRLADLEAQRGHPYYLIVRVPPALRNAQWSGLEVEQWMRRRLVDVVMPAQYLTLAHDMPVDEFAAAARDTGCKIYPSLYDWTNWRAVYADPVAAWPVAGDTRPRPTDSPMTRFVTPALVAGAISNYHTMGADGFELYNYRLPLVANHRAVAALFPAANALARRPRIYAVTHGYFNDQDDTFQYRKQLPVSLHVGAPVTLRLYVGDPAPSDSPAPIVTLRLGVRDVKAISDVRVTLNGHDLPTGGPASLVATAAQNRHDTATAYLHLPVGSRSPVRPGWNEITLTAADTTAPRALAIDECQLGVFPP